MPFIFQGEFLEEKKHGNGTYKFPSGNIYSGSYEVFHSNKNTHIVREFFSKILKLSTLICYTQPLDAYYYRLFLDPDQRKDKGSSLKKITKMPVYSSMCCTYQLTEDVGGNVDV
jgi:hypothetical protein